MRTLRRSARSRWRWAGGDAERLGKSATELAALAPDLIFATGSAAVGAMLRVTRTVPIVFAIVPDPVGSGFVNSLSRPGGNATGFIQFEYSLSGKWLELLKQIAPGALAVLWLITNSYLVGACTGRSLGFSPATDWVTANWPIPAVIAGSQRIAARVKRRSDPITEGASEAGAISRCKSGPGKA